MVSSTEWDGMLSAVNDEFGRSVTLRRVARAAPNTTTGVLTPTTASYSVTAVRDRVEPGSVTGSSGGPSEVYKSKYTVKVAEAELVAAGITPTSGTGPVKGWVIVDGGVTKQVGHVELTVDGRAWELYTKV